MRLIEVNCFDAYQLSVLYELLGERTPEQSISHKAMPSYAEHIAFVCEHPYRAWYLIENEAHVTVGAIYLHQFDKIGQGHPIGISIFKDHRRKGYAKTAIRLLMQKFGDLRYLANVNPDNAVSIALWQSLGFIEIQRTFGTR